MDINDPTLWVAIGFVIFFTCLTLIFSRQNNYFITFF